MKVIFPIAGTGKRFKDAGYLSPKPMILVDGRPMIQHVVNLFASDDEFIFVCNKEHLENPEFKLKEILISIRPNSKIIDIDPRQLGPNYAILQAGEFLDEAPVFVSYGDYNLFWDRNDFLKKINEIRPASASVCYKGFHPHLLGPNLYAGVRIDNKMFALEVREKFSFTPNKMDTWQQAGLFWFSSGMILKNYCERALKEGWFLNGESYTSLLFNPMIQDGLKSLVYPADYFCQWGTPEDLEEYEAWSRLFAEKFGKKKGLTKIPESRENNVHIKYNPDSEEYKKSYAYWEAYFLRKN